jgi:hypothetical protein
MSILFHKKSTRVPVGVGSPYTMNIEGKLRGILMHIIVEPDTSTTLFDFKLVDDDDVVLFHETDADGVINEQVTIPLKGTYRAVIENSTKAENFKLYLAIREI